MDERTVRLMARRRRRQRSIDREVLLRLGERPVAASSDDDETTGVEAISQAIARIIDHRLMTGTEGSVLVRSAGVVTSLR